MIPLPPTTRIYLACGATDMRKGFDSLAGLVSHQMQYDPTNGSVYIFMNKNRNLIKLLHWEYGGFTLYYKRLEKGLFERPVLEKNHLITWSQLVLIVEGIKLSSVVKKTRYKLPLK